jgi:hypothetical protein
MATDKKPAGEKMPANYVITDGKALDSEIASNEKAAFKWINRMQRIGVSALDHLARHGNIHFVNSAYLSMPKGTKSAGFTSWLLAHGALKANDGDDKKTKPFLYDKSKKTNVEAAYAEGWWEHASEKKPDQVFDLQQAIVKLIKQVEAKSEIAHAELLPALKSLVVIGAVQAEQGKVEAGEEGNKAILAQATDAKAATAAAAAVH